MKTIRLKQLKNEVKKSPLAFVVFTTSWCGDCKMMEPFLAKLEKSNTDVLFFSLDAEKENIFRDSNSEFKVLKVPTMILYKNGKEINRGYEFIPYGELQKWIDNAKQES